MTASVPVSDSPRPRIGAAARALTPCRYPVSDGALVEVIEDGPGIAGRLAWLGARLTIRPAPPIGSYVPSLPWPWGAIDFAARALPPIPGTVRTTVGLPNCTAHLVRAKGVPPPDETRRIVLYMLGGAFLTCGVSHGRLTTMISHYADTPVLVLDYRMIPKHSVGQAIEDCYDGWCWLRNQGYEPHHIVLAGDSAGGYLALALAERLLAEGEEPAALVFMSPLMQLQMDPKQAQPNIGSDAMLPPNAFDALANMVAEAAARRVVDEEPEEVFEPLDHVEPGLPRTLIHVSGSEVLVYDARLAARRLAGAGVPVEVHVWPGQVHDFQLCAPLLPEATRSLRQIGEYIREATG